MEACDGMFTLLNRFSLNAMTLSESGKLPDIPLMTISSPGKGWDNLCPEV